MIEKNLTPKAKRQHRIRRKIYSVSDRPRLVITRSNNHISGQIIDQSGKVVCAFSSQALKNAKGTKVEIATEVGKKISELAKDKKVESLVLDRGSYRFHGRVKALAEAIRQSGINL